ncbi:MAG: 50S ribosomal protein L30 [Gammaproteobacteria bacterium]|nr:50S ribosomal protein L30 [Gammaproteobacteria bacterium]
MTKNTLKVKLVKSPHGRLPKHRACVAGLGLRRVGSVRELEDTPAVRGMVAKVAYLLEVENAEDLA